MKIKYTQLSNKIKFIVILIVTFFVCAENTYSYDTQLFGKQISINGYISQGVQFGIAGDHYDTHPGFQQGLMQSLIEVDYLPSDNLRAFTSLQLVKDWAYEILDRNKDWQQKRFDRSKNELGFYDAYEDILKEAHVTWAPGNFSFRAGKQIISWGRMDGVRIMDQINPRDTRRGFADVEFETSIIPIWLFKAQYFPVKKPDFLNELSFEVVFDPNADFIGNKTLSTGNDVHGIWAADSVASGFRVGSINQTISTPDRWDSDGFQYGFRISGALLDYSLFTINYFKGLDTKYVSRAVPPYAVIEDSIMHPVMEGYYPDKEYLGFTLSKEFADWYVNALGGVAPLIRTELIYEIDSTFVSSGKGVAVQEYEKHDAVYWGIGIDWKIKAGFLNPRRMIAVVPQLSHRHIFDYPKGYTLNDTGGAAVEDDVFTASLRLSTSYYNDKIAPTIYFQRDVNGENSDLWLFKVTYTPDYHWKYALQMYLVGNKGYEAVDNKDNISLTVSYQF